MCPTRKSSLFQELFGEGVPLWQKLLTLVTFPLWGPVAVAVLAGYVILTGLVIGVMMAGDLLEKLSDA